jgi:hypothetical protein
MSLFGKTKRNRDTVRYQYVVYPYKSEKPIKKFNRLNNAKRYALSCGPNTTIHKSADYQSGSSSCVKKWQVWFNKEYTHIMLYRVNTRDFKIRYSKEEKIYRAYTYKVFTKMIAYPDMKVSNLIQLFRKRGTPLDNPTEDMIDYANRALEELKTLDDVQWSYWSDRCNDARAYVIYCLYKNNL